MNQISQSKIKFLKDYKVSSHLIDQVDLYIELGEEKIIITSNLSMRVNPDADKLLNKLILDGENLELLSIKLNENVLSSSQYQIDESALTILDVPEKFILEIKTSIKPQENLALSGLYKTSNIFCTQCEAEGFRRITYFLDRPDVLSKYTTTIAANKKSYPILLSNGNLVGSGDLAGEMHWFKWEDPHPKPCYLFAMVAGKLDFIEDYFVTQSGQNVTLRIFCEVGDREKCRYAMKSLKKAMRWDEEKYGREYDLNLFMIVAVHDFNFGAMENKGLNIFNAKYILAEPKAATDTDYHNIDRVVGHEYFHNWSGNRVTCRDWFQICLKEGFTVFRDQCFVEDISSRAVSRIDEVEALRETQFPEDVGPLAHPIRPESYIDISNFYTMTVYRKGAEVIRMLHTLLGAEKFRRGADLYFAKHDGFAVTCEDFISAMEEATNSDLSQFRLWYQQAGTPTLYLASKYYEEKQEWHLAISQVCPSTPGQEKKHPMQIPLALGLLDASGNEMPLKLSGVKKANTGAMVLDIRKEEELFVFADVKEKPIPSFLRNFSAPVVMEYQYRDPELAFLMAHDVDSFMRWEAAQIYALRMINRSLKDLNNAVNVEESNNFYDAYANVLESSAPDKALTAKMLVLPSEGFIALKQTVIDVDSIHSARELMRQEIVTRFYQKLLSVYHENKLNKPYEYNTEDAASRRLKNVCLSYLTLSGKPESVALCTKQFDEADNMTDKFAVLVALNDVECLEREEIFNKYYDEWKHDQLVLDKWFSIQAVSSLPNTIEQVKRLMKHPNFNLKNPNRVYALLGNFSRQNPVCFHDKSGEGYELLADRVIETDAFNAQIATRLLEPLTNWKRYDETRKHLMYEQLQRILAHPKLSKAVFEIASKSCS